MHTFYIAVDLLIQNVRVISCIKVEIFKTMTINMSNEAIKKHFRLIHCFKKNSIRYH